MEEGTPSLLAVIGLVSLGLFALGCYVGKSYENHEWRKLVPDSMDYICQECYDQGKGIK